jgi:prepilin-type N-terminal cleavage/methylation domain-containing protein
MDRRTYLKGFTMLELLIVIAIIGILVAIAMSALTQSKSKGADGGVKQNLMNARSQAEYYYNGAATSTYSYSGVCTDAKNGVMKHIVAAGQATNATYVVGNTQNVTISQAVCHESALGWAAAVPLKSVSGAYCVDNKSFSGIITLSDLDTDGDITCTN